MKKYDEYQKFMRYKYGSHSFHILWFLIFANYTFGTIYNIQWAETKELEYILLAYIAIFYTLIMYVYHGAYYKKNQLSILNTLFAGIFGFFYLFWSLSVHLDFISDGRITFNITLPFLGVMWLSTSVAYLIRHLAEKRKDVRDNNEEDGQ
ncbi:MAG: hypothetical protein JJU16_02910 [Alkalibacterium sp.]|nr:hypothetical protein [Alkalibacterium sp.]